MHQSLAVTAALAICGSASPLNSLQSRQSCPAIHIFGARETTAPAGYGTAGVVVNLILQAYSGSTAEAIVYPACGGQASCGGASYASSASQGTTAVASAVNAYAARCPSTQIVLVGYSQGAQITDNAFCGGGDSNQGIVSTAANTINTQAAAQVKAVIEMGNPRYIYGLSYQVGTCRAQGFSPRPAGFTCAGGSKVQSYCDAADPYCCTGNDANTHQGYGTKYGQAALTFVKSKLSASGGGGGGGGSSPTTTQPSQTSPTSGGGSVAHYGQCGGQGYSGSTTCASPYTCKAQSQYYSQCL